MKQYKPITIVTFAQLGKQHNLKTADILPVVQQFQEKGEVRRILAFQARNGAPMNALTVIPRALSFVLRKLKISRENTETLFDLIASMRLGKVCKGIIHPPHFSRAITRIREGGGTVTGLLVEAHPMFNRALYEEECALLGIPTSATYPWNERVAAATTSCNYLIAPSEFVKETYIARGFPSENIYVAPLDIDLTRFSPNQYSRGPVFRVLYMADTQPLKGLGYLLRAWEKCGFSDAELTVVGAFALPQQLAQIYGEYIDTHPTITRVDHVRDPESFYRKSSVFVCPSLTEGYSRTVAEAMACGLPVITTEHARGLVEDGKTGFVVPIRDVNALEEKLRFFYDNRHLIPEMGAAARLAMEGKPSFGQEVYRIVSSQNQ